MAKRTQGKSKLTPELEQRLEEMAATAQQWLYGAARCPEWGTSFTEIEDDAKELGQEFIRRLMQRTAADQAQAMPRDALVSEGGELAQPSGTEERTIETESGPVSWDEPKAYLPQSRKAFFPSVQGAGDGRG
jgi:hypothetical protein